MRPLLDGRGSQRGTAAVEFALVLPLVLVVALALVQTGLLVRDRLLVEAAARAGAHMHICTSQMSQLILRHIAI